jgi:hypothetical protein
VDAFPGSTPSATSQRRRRPPSPCSTTRCVFSPSRADFCPIMSWGGAAKVIGRSVPGHRPPGRSRHQCGTCRPDVRREGRPPRRREALRAQGRRDRLGQADCRLRAQERWVNRLSRHCGRGHHSAQTSGGGTALRVRNGSGPRSSARRYQSSCATIGSKSLRSVKAGSKKPAIQGRSCAESRTGQLEPMGNARTKCWSICVGSFRLSLKGICLK